jgi:H+/Cl- antiporter ClcA
MLLFIVIVIIITFNEEVDALILKGTKLQQQKSLTVPLHRRSHVLRRLAHLNCSPLCEFSDGGAVTITAANVSNNQRGWFAICKRLAALYTICATSSVLTGRLVLAIRRLFAFAEGLRRRRPALIHSAGGCALTMYALAQSSNFEIRMRPQQRQHQHQHQHQHSEKRGRQLLVPSVRGGFVHLHTIISRIGAGIVSVGTGSPLAFTGTAVELALVVPWLLTVRVREGLHKVFGVTASDIDLACLAGTASGVAANFNAPLAGLCWTMEVTVRRMMAEIWVKEDNYKKDSGSAASVRRSRRTTLLLLGLTTVSALVTAYTMGGGTFVPVSTLAPFVKSSAEASAEFYKRLVFNEAWYSSSGKAALSPSVLKMLPVAALIGLGARLLTSLDLQVGAMCSRLARGLPVPVVVYPIVASVLHLGMGMGVGVGVPVSLPEAYQQLRALLHGGPVARDPKALLAFFLVWQVGSRASIALGHLGGLVAPAMVEGATAVALLAHVIPAGLFPRSTLTTIASAAQIGSAAVLAATFKAPFMATALLLELTRAPSMLAPTLLACLFAAK